MGAEVLEALEVIRFLHGGLRLKGLFECLNHLVTEALEVAYKRVGFKKMKRPNYLFQYLCKPEKALVADCVLHGLKLLSFFCSNLELAFRG